MSRPMTRKDFLGFVFQQPTRLILGILDSLYISNQRQSSELNISLAADLPEDLLAHEARRLGLNPENREEVVATIQREMESRTPA